MVTPHDRDGFRRFVIFHDPDGAFRLAADTRADEIRRAMMDAGKQEGRDFAVETYPVSRASQVSHALRFGRARASTTMCTPASSVDFFHHAGSQAIYLDKNAKGADTNLALGPFVAGQFFMEATPFRKVLRNLQPWGEVNVHGCKFGRPLGSHPAGARQLANEVDQVVRAYSNPAGTIFTQDPELAFGMRKSTDAECSAGKDQWLHDKAKPVWMVPCRAQERVDRRTFLPDSLTRYMKKRGFYEDAIGAGGELLPGFKSMTTRGLGRGNLSLINNLAAQRVKQNVELAFPRVRIHPDLGAKLSATRTFALGGGPPHYSSDFDGLMKRFHNMDTGLHYTRTASNDTLSNRQSISANVNAFSNIRLDMHPTLSGFNTHVYDSQLRQDADSTFSHIRISPTIGVRLDAMQKGFDSLVTGVPMYSSGLKDAMARFHNIDISLSPQIGHL